MVDSTIIGVQAIEEILPHRHPIRFPEQIHLEDNTVWGTCNSEAFGPYLHKEIDGDCQLGKVDDESELPKLLAIEFGAQTGAFYALSQKPGSVALFTGISNARFDDFCLPDVMWAGYSLSDLSDGGSVHLEIQDGSPGAGLDSKSPSRFPFHKKLATADISCEIVPAKKLETLKRYCMRKTECDTLLDYAGWGRLAEITVLLPKQRPLIQDGLKAEGKKMEARVALTEDCKIFDGHFPDSPIFPGVFTVWGGVQMAQASFMGLERVKTTLHIIEQFDFSMIIQPPTVLKYEGEITADNGKHAKVEVVAFIQKGDTKHEVAKGTLIFQKHERSE